jgi:hypothetical protein
LEQNLETFSPPVQQDARRLAERVLQWPIHERGRAGRDIVDGCQRILAAAEASAAAAGSRPGAAADSAGKAPAGGDDLIPLATMPKLHGGGLPVETASMPTRSEAAPAAAKEPNPLRESPAVQTAQRLKPDGGDNRPSGREPSDASGANESGSNRRTAIAPVIPLAHRSAQRSSSDGWRSAALDWQETIASMRRLQSADARQVDDAQHALSLSGFTRTHLEIAKRMFHPDAAVRKQLARALPAIPGLDATPWLFQLAEDSQFEVRATAIGLLLTTNDPAVVARAKAIAQADPEQAVRMQVDATARKSLRGEASDRGDEVLR